MRTRDLLVICVNQNQVAFHSILAVGSEKASHTRIHISAFVVAYHVLHILGCHSCNFSKNQKIKKRRLRASTVNPEHAQNVKIWGFLVSTVNLFNLETIFAQFGMMLSIVSALIFCEVSSIVKFFTEHFFTGRTWNFFVSRVFQLQMLFDAEFSRRSVSTSFAGKFCSLDNNHGVKRH